MKKPWSNSVREPVYATDAPKQTVSLTINSDLFTRVKSLGINASRIAEEALVLELERHRRATILAEVEADVRAVDAYMAQHGNYTEQLLEYFEASNAVRLQSDD